MRRDLADAAADETWSVPIGWVAFTVSILSVLTVVGIVLVAQTLAGRAGPPLPFMLFWFIALGWNVYWWLFRVAYRVELVGNTVRWRAPLIGGALPVSAIRSVGRAFGAPFSCVLRADGHRSVTVFSRFRSFAPMLTALNRLNPDVPPRQ